MAILDIGRLVGAAASHFGVFLWVQIPQSNTVLNSYRELQRHQK